MATNDYCTINEIKSAMPDGNWGSGYDTLFASLATRASRTIDNYVGKKPGAFYVSTDVTRYFDGSGNRILKIGELAAAPTSVAVSENGGLTEADYALWASTDYMLYPLNALDAGLPYTELLIDTLNGAQSVWYAYPKSVKIVGKFGYSSSVPEDVRQAAIIQAVRLFKRGQNAFQDATANAEMGQLIYTKKIDPEVQQILNHYRGGPL